MSVKVKIDDSGWRKLLGRVGELARKQVAVGVIGGADSDIVDIATTHEFGDPARRIPERSYLRRTFEKDEVVRERFFGRVAGAVVEGKLSAEQGLGLIGTREVAEVKKTIAGGPHIPPPLQPATIAAKGSDRPLVDTGRLLNAISYEVK